MRTQQEVAQSILQKDVTGGRRGLTPVSGRYIVGKNHKNQAICLVWPGGDGEVTPYALREALQEADAGGYSRPCRIYGVYCRVAEIPERWTFCQIEEV